MVLAGGLQGIDSERLRRFVHYAPTFTRKSQRQNRAVRRVVDNETA